MQKIFVCWCTVSEMVALKCKSSDPDVGEHDSDLTTSGMHMEPPACIRNDKSCHLWRYDVYNCTTYIMKSTSSNSTTDFRKKKRSKVLKVQPGFPSQVVSQAKSKNPCPLHPQRFGFRRGLHILSQHVEA